MKDDTPYEFWGADCSKCTKGNDCRDKDLLESKYGYVFGGYPDEACSAFVRRTGEGQTMTNEDAIKILEEMPISSNVHFEEIAEAIGIAIKALRNERPHGEWIEGYCNKCGVSSLCDGWGRDVESRFCPNCGADMREVDNEQ